MKAKLNGFSRLYHAALRRHLMRQGRTTGARSASGLGRQAMMIGLETLDLARIHEEALVTLTLPRCDRDTRARIVRRAGAFFAETITPLEKTHRTAQEANSRFNQMIEMLSRRGLELTEANRQLKQEILQRKSAEESLRKSEQHYTQLLEQSAHMQQQLRLLSRQLLLAQEEERKKISRELHDVIAQTLTSINVQLARLKKEAVLDARGLERNIARTQKLVEQSVDVVHRFARELRPTVLDDLGLIPALHTFMKSFRQQTGIRVSLSAFASIEKLNGDRRTVLYRIAQEALTNVARHAHASHAEVRIEKTDGAISMKIIDDGKGIHEKQLQRAREANRLGMIGMRERLEMVGGKLTVTSIPGRGTTVAAQVPLMDFGGGGEAPLMALAKNSTD